MTVLEWSAIIAALSMAVIATAIVAALWRAIPLWKRLDATLTEARRALQRMRQVTREIQHLSRDVRRLEHRVSRTAHGLLDQVEPPLKLVGALIAGARSGFSAWTRASNDDANGNHLKSKSTPPLERSAT